MQKYAVFSGRARRSEYWYFVLFLFLISIVIGFFEGLLGFQIGGVDMPDGEGGVRKIGGVGIISLALTLLAL